MMVSVSPTLSNTDADLEMWFSYCKDDDVASREVKDASRVFFNLC